MLTGRLLPRFLAAELPGISARSFPTDRTCNLGT